MWEYAARVAPPDTIQEHLQLITYTSPTHWWIYILGVIFTAIGLTVVGALFYSRARKRLREDRMILSISGDFEAGDSSSDSDSKECLLPKMQVAIHD